MARWTAERVEGYLKDKNTDSPSTTKTRWTAERVNNYVNDRSTGKKDEADSANDINELRKETLPARKQQVIDYSTQKRISPTITQSNIPEVKTQDETPWYKKAWDSVKSAFTQEPQKTTQPMNQSAIDAGLMRAGIKATPSVSPREIPKVSNVDLQKQSKDYLDTVKRVIPNAAGAGAAGAAAGIEKFGGVAEEFQDKYNPVDILWNKIFPGTEQKAKEINKKAMDEFTGQQEYYAKKYTEGSSEGQKFIGQGVEAVTAMLPQLVLSIATGGTSAEAQAASGIANATKSVIPGLTKGAISKFGTQLAEMTPFMIQAAGGYAKEAEDKGASLEQQIAYGLAGGLAEGVTEMIPMGALKKALGVGDDAAKKVLKKGTQSLIERFGKKGLQWVVNAGTNVIEEIAVNPITGFAEKAILDKNKPVFGKGGILDPEQAKESATGALGMSLVLTALGLPANLASHKLAAKYVESGKPLTIAEAQQINAAIKKDISQQPVATVTTETPVISAKQTPVQVNTAANVKINSEASQAVTGQREEIKAGDRITDDKGREWNVTGTGKSMLDITDDSGRKTKIGKNVAKKVIPVENIVKPDIIENRGDDNVLPSEAGEISGVGIPAGTKLDKVASLRKAVQYLESNGVERINAEIDNGNTLEQKQIQRLMSELGTEVVFYKSGSKIPVDGIYDPELKNTVFVRSTDKLNMTWAAGHEFFHTLKVNHKDLYDIVLEIHKGRITTEQKTKYLKGFDNTPGYQEALLNDENKLVEEMLADESGNVFTDKTFWEKVNEKSADLFDRLVKIVRELFGSLKALKYTNYLEEEQIKQFEKDFEVIITAVKARTAESIENKQVKKQTEGATYASREKEARKEDNDVLPDRSGSVDNTLEERRSRGKTLEGLSTTEYQKLARQGKLTPADFYKYVQPSTKVLGADKPVIKRNMERALKEGRNLPDTDISFEQWFFRVNKYEYNLSDFKRRNLYMLDKHTLKQLKENEVARYRYFIQQAKEGKEVEYSSREKEERALSTQVIPQYDERITTGKTDNVRGQVKGEFHTVSKSDEKPYVEDLINKVYDRAIDALQPLNRFGKAYGKKPNESLYAKAMAAKMADKQARIIALQRMIDSEGNTIGKSLKDILKPLNKDKKLLAAFDDYLVYKHAPAWMKKNRTVFAKDLNMTIEDCTNLTAVIEIEHPEFVQMQKDLMKFQRQLAKAWLVDTGILSQESWDNFLADYPNYVPLMRSFKQVEKKGGYRPRSGYINQRSPVKKATGSQRDIISPIESIIEHIGQYTKVAKRNEAGQAFLDIIRANREEVEDAAKELWPEIVMLPGPGKVVTAQVLDSKGRVIENLYFQKVMEEEGIEGVVESYNRLYGFEDDTGFRKKTGNMVTVIKDGKPVHIEVFDTGLLDALMSMTPKQMNNFTKAFGAVTKTMKTLTTGLNLSFGIARNIWRDLVTGYVASKTSSTVPVYGYLKYMFELTGAITDMMIGEDTKGKGAFIKFLDKKAENYRSYENMGGGGFASSLSADVKHLERAKNEIMGRVFIGSRLVGVLETVNNTLETAPRLAEYKRVVKKEGNTYAGRSKGIYEANDLTVNFSRFGDDIKAADNYIPFLNAAMQGVDKTIRIYKDEPIKAILKSIYAVTIPSILLYFLNHRDDETAEAYEMLNNYTKDNFFCVAYRDSEGVKFFKIPKPREIGTIFGALPERLLRMFKDEEPEAFADYAETLRQNWMPPLSLDSFILYPAYRSLKLGQNWRGNDLESYTEQQLSPMYRYDEKTSGISKFIGEKLNVSPKRLDDFWRSYFGGVAQYGIPLTSEAGGTINKTFMAQMTADPVYSTDALNNFYDLRKVLTTKEADEKAGKYEMTSDERSLLKTVKKTAEKLTDLRKNADKATDLKEKRSIRLDMNSMAMELYGEARAVLEK